MEHDVFVHLLVAIREEMLVLYQNCKIVIGYISRGSKELRFLPQFNKSGVQQTLVF